MSKIRTINELQDAVDAESAWRRKELSAIKSNIASSRHFAKNTALRAGIALLYAHWEGMIKNIASDYLEYISHQKNTYSEITDNFLALSISKKLDDFSETKKASVHNQILREIEELYPQRTKIPYENVISTKSNLNSDVFVEIMETIGLPYDMYEDNFKLLDEVLLKMRNGIAHGEQLDYISLDEERYNEIYEKIVEMMEQFKNQVMDAAMNKKYLKSSLPLSR